MNPIENEGRTVAEAVESALRRSGLRRDQVEVTVLDEGASGFVGLGSKPARVRLTEKRWTVESADALCAKAQDIVLELLRLMKIAAPTATTVWDPDLERVKVSVESQDAVLLAGRDGRVLEALQFLATLMMSRQESSPVAVQVDALSFWEKRESAVLEEARNAADRVRATGKPVRLEPMDAAMRRLIHRTFSAIPDVATSSEGEGPWRKIVLRPKERANS